MRNLFTLFFIITVIVFVIKFLKSLNIFNEDVPVAKEKEQEYFPYVKKKYFLSVNERKFFEALEEVVGDKYYVFAQVHLSSLLYVDYNERKRRTYRSKIDKKSVDFAILDKHYLIPKLAIEVDDKSHNQEKRRERDHFVNGAFKAAGIPLLRVKASNYYDPEEIRKKMNEIATKEESIN